MSKCLQFFLLLLCLLALVLIRPNEISLLFETLHCQEDLIKSAAKKLARFNSDFGSTDRDDRFDLRGLWNWYWIANSEN